MNEQMQSCNRCGAVKPLSEFRPYYGNRKGHYKHCLECEKIETRRKYLSSKKSLTPNEQHELDAIHKLYAMQMERGLKSPCLRSSATNILDVVEQRMAEMHAK